MYDKDMVLRNLKMFTHKHCSTVASRTIYCIAHAQYHQSQDFRNGGRRPTFLLHFNGHLLTFQDVLECLTVYQYI